jgi:SAM-dependent methyltransferase
MSDGYSSDQAMWESGERDFKQLMVGLDGELFPVGLEVGCGVGRLLPAAAGTVGSMIGVDISDGAVARARELLVSHANISLHTGNGFDLSMIGTGIVDLVFSFAALTTTPPLITAGYLTEIRRILSPGGVARLQLYVGTPQLLGRGSTFQLWCYDQVQLVRAVELAGFSVESIRDLDTPFQSASTELGIRPVVLGLRVAGKAESTKDAIAALLDPDDMILNGTTGVAIDIESWRSVQFVEEMLQKGEHSEVLAMVRYVIEHCPDAPPKLVELYKQIAEQLTTNSNEP